MITVIDINTIQVPFTCEDESRFRIVTASGKSFNITSITNNGDGTTTLVSSEDIIGVYFVGLTSQMRYQLGNLEMKVPTADNTQSTNFSTKDNLSTMAIAYSDTAHFIVEIDSPQRAQRTVEFTSVNIGYDEIGAADLETGTFRFHVRGKTADTSVTITDESVFPISLQYVEIERKISSRSRR